MGKKKKKEKDQQEHRLLQPVDNFKVGRQIGIRECWETYLLPELQTLKRRPSTFYGIKFNVEQWELWLSQQGCLMLPIAKIDRRHLIEFRDWLTARGASATSANRAVSTIGQILRCGIRNTLIKDAPRLEALPHRGVAPKVFPSDDELTRVWEAFEYADWPTRTSQGQRLHYSATTGWRALLIILRSYGLRIQEAVMMETGFRSLQWSNIHPPGPTPNPEGRTECEHGWLVYTPQKQERVKPDPLFLPLNATTKAAIDAVRPSVIDPNGLVFDWSLSSVSFYKSWYLAFAQAQVRPKQLSGVKRYTPKHMRKSATTHINLHMPGLAQHIVGHGGDRSGQQSVISAKHYDNQEQAVLECVASMPLPECFSTLKG